MSYLDTLRTQRAMPQAIWLKFVGDYRSGGLDLYLFVEGGEDLSYYQHYVRQKWPYAGMLHGYMCNGKDAVIELIPRIKRSLDSEWRALFFVDKDIDDLCHQTTTTDNYLFETDVYSIENYIVAPLTLTLIWTDLFGLSATDSSLTVALSAFDVAYRSFVDVMNIVMGWIVHLRRSGIRVVLNSVKISNVIDLDDNCICNTKVGWWQHILASSSIHNLVYSSADCASVCDEIRSIDAKKYIRGKFDLWFFVSFLGCLAAILRQTCENGQRLRSNVQITAKNAIDILAPRLPAPAALSAFLDRVLPTSSGS